MANRGIQLIIAIATLIVSVVLTRAPIMMAAEAPTKGAWADGPMKLIPTPMFETKKV
jgi:hypothetical protein